VSTAALVEFASGTLLAPPPRVRRSGEEELQEEGGTEETNKKMFAFFKRECLYVCFCVSSVFDICLCPEEGGKRRRKEKTNTVATKHCGNKTPKHCGNKTQQHCGNNIAVETKHNITVAKKLTNTLAKQRSNTVIQSGVESEDAFSLEVISAKESCHEWLFCEK